MKYVNMHEVAFDQISVAFPGLGNCHGIVYVNNHGLFAYHLAGDPVANRWDVNTLGWPTTYVEVVFNAGAITSTIESFQDQKVRGPNPDHNNHRRVPPNSTAMGVSMRTYEDEVITGVTRTGAPLTVAAAEL
jgi:hypothetical protein